MGGGFPGQRGQQSGQETNLEAEEGLPTPLEGGPLSCRSVYPQGGIQEAEGQQPRSGEQAGLSI